MSVVIPTAQEARMRASSVTSQAVGKAVLEAVGAIEDAIDEGRCETTLSHRWGSAVISSVCKLLGEKGYSTTTGDDQRDGAWLTVRW